MPTKLLLLLGGRYMLTISAIFLFLSSYCFLELLRFCQAGPGWEVPQGIAGMMTIFAFVGGGSLLVSLGLFIADIRNLLKVKLRSKILHMVWLLSAILPAIKILIKGTPIYALEIHDPLFREKIDTVFWLGISACFILMAVLLVDYTIFFRKKGKVRSSL
jgi:hypothetical protein